MGGTCEPRDAAPAPKSRTSPNPVRESLRFQTPFRETLLFRSAFRASPSESRPGNVAKTARFRERLTRNGAISARFVERCDLSHQIIDYIASRYPIACILKRVHQIYFQCTPLDFEPLQYETIPATSQIRWYSDHFLLLLRHYPTARSDYFQRNNPISLRMKNLRGLRILQLWAIYKKQNWRVD